MARSPLIFAVQLKSGPAGRLRLGVGHLVDTLTDDDLVTTPMASMLETLAEVAQREAVSTSRSSGVAREIFTEIEPTLARVRLPLAYGATLNKGRKADARMPSTNDLHDWARSHGWSGRLFVLARAIKRRGIRGRFFMRKARAAVRRDMPAAIAEMDRSIERRFEGRPA